MTIFQSFSFVPVDFTGQCYLLENQAVVKYNNGKYHSEDGTPAIIDNYLMGWYKNGLGHNLLGPAMLWKNGKKIYAIEGVFLSEKEYFNHPLVIDGFINQILEL